MERWKVPDRLVFVAEVEEQQSLPLSSIILFQLQREQWNAGKCYLSLSLSLHLLFEPTMVVALFEEDARWQESGGGRTKLSPPFSNPLVQPTSCPPEPTLH